MRRCSAIRRQPRRQRPRRPPSCAGSPTSRNPTSWPRRKSSRTGPRSVRLGLPVEPRLPEPNSSRQLQIRASNRCNPSDPRRRVESRGREEEPAEPAERRGIDQQGGATPSAPGLHRVEALPPVQELRLPAQLLMDPTVEAERGERMALGHAREGDQPEALRLLLDENEVETGSDVS